MGIDTLHCTDIPHMLDSKAYFSRRLEANMIMVNRT